MSTSRRASIFQGQLRVVFHPSNSPQLSPHNRRPLPRYPFYVSVSFVELTLLKMFKCITIRDRSCMLPESTPLPHLTMCAPSWIYFSSASRIPIGSSSASLSTRTQSALPTSTRARSNVIPHTSTTVPAASVSSMVAMVARRSWCAKSPTRWTGYGTSHLFCSWPLADPWLSWP